MGFDRLNDERLVSTMGRLWMQRKRLYVACSCATHVRPVTAQQNRWASRSPRTCLGNPTARSAATQGVLRSWADAAHLPGRPHCKVRGHARRAAKLGGRCAPAGETPLQGARPRAALSEAGRSPRTCLEGPTARLADTPCALRCVFCRQPSSAPAACGRGGGHRRQPGVARRGHGHGLGGALDFDKGH